MNRRGFISLLHGIPVIGAVARFLSPHVSEHVPDYESNPWYHEAMRYAANADYWMSRSVKWIPIENRLPDLSAEGNWLQSDRLLIAAGRTVVIGRLVRYAGDNVSTWVDSSTCAFPVVTHWAELPASPPE